ncbi:hypothetical protein [Candidatus Protofrankia californiensis]|uniref:hypothetical protein n=1 Tax=Candidatus Protofrankia californiensis TaxID=1839754 RepID=UPI001041B06E|nr:hypothetical protein [Candidatus Protofrankia californiensis]
MAPRLWANAAIDEAKKFYADNALAGPAPWLFDLAKLWSFSDFYRHIDPDTAAFAGRFNTELVDPHKSDCENYVAQALYQHEGAYQPFFDLDGLEWPVIRPPATATVWTTAPIHDQPVELPDDVDSPEAEDLAEWIAAGLDFVTDTD